MAQVLCKLPNASELINGVKFTPGKLGMLSEDITDEQAAHFLQIKGYVAVKAPAATPPKAPAAQVTDTAAEQAAAQAAAAAAEAEAAKVAEAAAAAAAKQA